MNHAIDYRRTWEARMASGEWRPSSLCGDKPADVSKG